MAQTTAPAAQKRSGQFRGSGLWGVILGGSSGFGLATAKRLASEGLNIIIGHKDPDGLVESTIRPHFDQIREQEVELVTHNANLFDEDARGAVLESIEQHAGPGKVHLFMHSIAAGSCKLLVEERGPDFKALALKGLSEALAKEGVQADPAALKRAVNSAFHDKGCDALYKLADTRIPHRDTLLSEEELARTVNMMGLDYLLWGRELQLRGLLAPSARLISMTSEGNEVAWKGYAAVSAAKCAMEALCRSMALELAPHGVRCFIVQAGITDTPAGNGIPNFDIMKAQARLRNPLHRLTTTDDIAKAILALCSPAFDWANGSIIRVDGGEAISGA
jgi:NAD(P)-dependent dehydrogenase (short-subunit alcohol dehydrogenase family)